MLIKMMVQWNGDDHVGAYHDILRLTSARMLRILTRTPFKDQYCQRCRRRPPGYHSCYHWHNDNLPPRHDQHQHQAGSHHSCEVSLKMLTCKVCNNPQEDEPSPQRLHPPALSSSPPFSSLCYLWLIRLSTKNYRYNLVGQSNEGTQFVNTQDYIWNLYYMGVYRGWYGMTPLRKGHILLLTAFGLTLLESIVGCPSRPSWAQSPRGWMGMCTHTAGGGQHCSTCTLWPSGFHKHTVVRSSFYIGSTI